MFSKELVITFTLAMAKLSDVANGQECKERLSCDDWWEFNDLACQCFKTVKCEIACMPEMGLAPFDECECWTANQIRALFPDSVTDEQI